jgi:hypothetical protein
LPAHHSLLEGTGGRFRLPSSGERGTHHPRFLDPVQRSLALADDDLVEAGVAVSRTSIRTGPISVNTVLMRVPVAGVAAIAPDRVVTVVAGCSLISASQAVSSTVLVNPVSRPSEPTSSTSPARAASTSCWATVADQSVRHDPDRRGHGGPSPSCARRVGPALDVGRAARDQPHRLATPDHRHSRTRTQDCSDTACATAKR